MGDMKGFSKGAFVLLGAFVASILVYSVFADANMTHVVGGTLTVPGFVETSMSASTVSFGSLNPGTANNSATVTPAITLTNTANSNTAIDIYLNNTNMTMAGGNWISYRNLSIWTANVPNSGVNFNSTYVPAGDTASRLNGTSANNGFIKALAVSGTVDFYFWQDVPSGQAPGAYNANITIHSIQTGTY